MKTIEQAISENIQGLYYGSRVILPFVVDVLKAIVDDDIVVDFSHRSKIAYYQKHQNFTEIYFFEHEDLLKDVSKYETIKLVVVEEGKNMFNFSNHKKISLNPIEHHGLEISLLDEDVLFIE